MGEVLLLVSKKSEDLHFAQEVAATLGLPLEVVDAISALKRARESSNPIILADISEKAELDEFHRVFKDEVGEVSNQIHPNFIHFIAGEQSDEDVLSEGALFGHFIIRKFSDLKAAGAYYSKIIERLCLKRGATSLPYEGETRESVVLNHSDEKKLAIETLTKFLDTKVGFSARVVPIIVNAVDELLMNAIYDAPIDENGEQKLRHAPRTTPIALTGKSTVEMKMGFDGEYAGFSVVDQYGSIDRVKLLKHLLAAHRSKEYHVDTSVEGAGLGLATTFKTGGSLIFMKTPGERTEVAVMFKNTSSFREFREQFRFVSIHITEN